MSASTRVSYGVLAFTIILAGFLHLGAPLLVVLFSYFALRQLYYLTKRKWLALVLFIVVVTGIAAAAVYFTRAIILALPDVAETSIPSASAWAQRRQIELPFTDFESLRTVVIDTLKEEAHYLQDVAHFAIVRMPHAPLLIAITFLCGLVPIVGNLVSNTIIVFIALTISLKLAIGALVFLVLIHKLEYFLNSKIIGSRIRNPVWLTLISLIIGERLMGIPGLILAPVVLNYLRVEMLKIEVPRMPEKR